MGFQEFTRKINTKRLLKQVKDTLTYSTKMKENFTILLVKSSDIVVYTTYIFKGKLFRGERFTIRGGYASVYIIDIVIINKTVGCLWIGLCKD